MQYLHSRKLAGWCVCAASALCAPLAVAQSLNASQLGQALKKGGYVIVMRHASSPQTPPQSSEADPENKKLERQLDQTGISTAEAMGKTIKRLHLPIGTVYSSPAFRAMETVRYAQLGHAIPVQELGDRGVSMSATSPSQTDWLRNQAKHFVPGQDVFIVTHLPNITAAFPEVTPALRDGECLVFAPDVQGGTKLVARIGTEDWPSMQG